MSSSAFFIEAAANTVRLLSCAKAGDRADPHRITKAARRMARRCIVSLRAGSRPRFQRAQNQALVKCGMRQAEAPFPRSRGLTVQRDIAAKTITGWELS